MLLKQKPTAAGLCTGIPVGACKGVGAGGFFAQSRSDDPATINGWGLGMGYRVSQLRLHLVCTAKGVQAADEMLRIANNLQRA
jgi:hypothetical protein